MEQEPTFVGIDVSKAQVDVAIRPTGQRWVVSYDDSGVRELVSQMVDLGSDLVLMESTGGLDCPWLPPWPLLRCRWSWSTRVKSETSAGPLECWPRPMPWTRRS